MVLSVEITDNKSVVSWGQVPQFEMHLFYVDAKMEGSWLGGSSFIVVLHRHVGTCRVHHNQMS